MFYEYDNDPHKYMSEMRRRAGLPELEEDKKEREERLAKEAEKNEYIKQLEELSSHMLLTTASCLEGYTVVRQLGVVYGETVLKTSFMSGIVKYFEDRFNELSFREVEMSGQMKLIEKTRAYAYKKMTIEAAKRGANAIIAIDSDNSVGSEIMYLSLYGTAVYVEPIDYATQSDLQIPLETKRLRRR